MKSLVIVESPTKIKTLKQYLPKDYIIDSSMGHIRDLPASAKEIPSKFKDQDWANLGVNTDEDFEPLYVIPRGKKKVVIIVCPKLDVIGQRKEHCGVFTLLAIEVVKKRGL